MKSLGKLTPRFWVEFLATYTSVVSFSFLPPPTTLCIPFPIHGFLLHSPVRFGSFLTHPCLCPPLLLPPTPWPLFLSSRSCCPVSCAPSLSGPPSLPPSFSTFRLRPTDFLLVSFLFFFKEFLDEMRRGLKGAPGSPRLGENLGRRTSDHRPPLNLICS